LINGALVSTAPAIRAKGLTLSLHTGTEPLLIRGDPVRLTQCLSNLLTNATKFTTAGGEIRVVTRSEGALALIAVTDTGIGIRAELLPQVFDIFVQGERSLDRAQGGLGIGLSVCKRLVEMHGGQIMATSDGEHRGATFSIRLPRIESA